MVSMVLIGGIVVITAIILVVFFTQGKGKAAFRKVTRRQTPEMGRYRDILGTAEKIAYEKQYSKATQFVYKSFAELAREKMGIIWAANMTAEEFVESMVSRDAMLNIHDLMSLTAAFERSRYGKGEITPTEYNKGVTAFKNVFRQMYLEGSRMYMDVLKEKKAKGNISDQAYNALQTKLKSKLGKLTPLEDTKK